MIGLLKILDLLRDSKIRVNTREKSIKILRDEQVVAEVKFYDDDVFNDVYSVLKQYLKD